MQYPLDESPPCWFFFCLAVVTRGGGIVVDIIVLRNIMVAIVKIAILRLGCRRLAGRAETFRQSFLDRYIHVGSIVHLPLLARPRLDLEAIVIKLAEDSFKWISDHHKDIGSSVGITVRIILSVTASSLLLLVVGWQVQVLNGRMFGTGFPSHMGTGSMEGGIGATCKGHGLILKQTVAPRQINIGRPY
jgi:hypothetical protein